MNSTRWLELALFIGAVATAALPSVALAAEKDKDKEEGPEIEDKMDKDQPPVTAGGLYSISTFPLREINRTLTLPMGVFEFLARINVDLSENTPTVAFKQIIPLTVSAKYGLSDTLQLEAGTNLFFSSLEGVNLGKNVYAAAEIALMYDLVDARVEVILPLDPKFYFNAAVGLPFKFRLNDKIAILGLERLLIIHTADEHVAGDPNAGSTNSPDLNVSLAGLYQVIDPLAVIVRASLYVPEFKFSDKRQLPVDLDIQYSVSNVFDVGIGVSLMNLAPPTGAGKATDKRSFRVFARFRI